MSEEHCWEPGEWYQDGAGRWTRPVCLLPARHAGAHDFRPSDEVRVEFREASAAERDSLADYVRARRQLRVGRPRRR